MSTELAMPARLEPQPFEAQFLGGSAYRLALSAAADTAAVAAAMAPVRATARLVVARVPVAATALQAALREAGFRAIERLVTFERQLDQSLPDWPDDVRLSRVDDLAACAAIGRAAFRFDRFHADIRIGAAVADAMKEAWVRNDMSGRADSCLVAIKDERVVGFNLGLLSGVAATIDLIAVAPGQQGCGIGRRLTEAGMRHYGGRARVYRAGTQADNRSSVALYRRLGFEIAAEAVTFHWMPDRSGAGR